MFCLWLEQRVDSSNHRLCLFASFTDATQANERSPLPAACVWVHVIYRAISHEAHAALRRFERQMTAQRILKTLIWRLFLTQAVTEFIFQTRSKVAFSDVIKSSCFPELKPLLFVSFFVKSHYTYFREDDCI